MDANTISLYADIVDILVKIVLLTGTGWGVYKFVQYRELKQRIQLDIDAISTRKIQPELIGDARISNDSRRENHAI